MIAVVMAPTVVAAVTTAANQDDDDDDEPETGTVVVSVVKPHDCHLTLRHSMRQFPFGSLTL